MARSGDWPEINGFAVSPVLLFRPASLRQVRPGESPCFSPTKKSGDGSRCSLLNSRRRTAPLSSQQMPHK